MATDPHSIIIEYDSRKDAYINLSEIVNKRIVKLLKRKVMIQTHSITKRIKTVDSLLDKVRAKKIKKPFEEVHDIVGLRIVCLVISDLKKISDNIKDEFDVFDEDDKVNNSEYDVFGYMSIHLKAKLKPTENDKHDSTLNKIPFEIQIRTIAQDAWASVSHYLDYKNTNSIIDELKKDFNALSGLFYVADTHFVYIREKQRKIKNGNNE